jgi:hypothetical protein
VTIRGSLRDTSGVLVTVGSRVRTINAQLRQARSAESQGTAAVVPLVASINSDAALSGILSDTHKINAGLTDAHNHLTSICGSTAIQALGALGNNKRC